MIGKAVSRLWVLALPPLARDFVPEEDDRESGMSDTTEQRSRTVALAAVSNAMVKLHKEQFGRGPTSARTDFAGPDTVVSTLEDALLPAERAMVEMGEQQRVRETRTFLQVATQNKFVRAVEENLYRKVRAFASATDPDAAVVFEVFALEPIESSSSDDGSGPA
jgi:uncharacterized protein YbcI